MSDPSMARLARHLRGASRAAVSTAELVHVATTAAQTASNTARRNGQRVHVHAGPTMTGAQVRLSGPAAKEVAPDVLNLLYAELDRLRIGIYSAARKSLVQ